MANGQINVLQLNSVIGIHLLRFLKGIDASNFLEVVNDRDRFVAVASRSDQLFLTITKKFHGLQKRLLAPEVYEQYLDGCEVIDDKLVPLESNNLLVVQPIQRLFVYSCFSVEGFETLSRAYQTPLF